MWVLGIIVTKLLLSWILLICNSCTALWSWHPVPLEGWPHNLLSASMPVQHFIPFIAASQLSYMPCKASNRVLGGKPDVNMGFAVFKASAFSLLKYTQSKVYSMSYFVLFSPTLSATSEDQRDLSVLHKSAQLDLEQPENLFCTFNPEICDSAISRWLQGTSFLPSPYLLSFATLSEIHLLLVIQ